MIQIIKHNPVKFIKVNKNILQHWNVPPLPCTSLPCKVKSPLWWLRNIMNSLKANFCI